MTSLGSEARFYQLQPTGKRPSIRKSEEHERGAFSMPCNAIDGLRFTARATIFSRSRCFCIFFSYTVYQVEFYLGSEKPVLIYKLRILRGSGDRRLPEPLYFPYQTLPTEKNSTALQAMKKNLFILTNLSALLLLNERLIVINLVTFSNMDSSRCTLSSYRLRSWRLLSFVA